MRGSIKQRSPGSWTIRLDLGYQADATGRRRRTQQTTTFRGTKREAESHLAGLVRAVDRGESVRRSTLTVAEWFTEWLEKAVKPPAKRPSTYAIYSRVLNGRVIPAIGTIRLQALKALDLKRYYTDTALSPSTLAQHHAIIHGALKAATLEGLVARNVASLVVGKPQARRDHSDIANNVWDADAARRFLIAAKAAGPQPAALFALCAGLWRPQERAVRASVARSRSRTG